MVFVMVAIKCTMLECSEVPLKRHPFVLVFLTII